MSVALVSLNRACGMICVACSYVQTSHRTHLIYSGVEAERETIRDGSSGKKRH